MSLTTGLQIPFGVQPLNPLPVDTWSGPYTGVPDTLADAIAAANAAINPLIRFKSMEVRLIVGGVARKYWYQNGTSNSDLVEFSGASNKKIEVYCPTTPTGGTKAHFDVEISSDLTFSPLIVSQSTSINQTGFYYFNGLIYLAYPSSGIDVDIFGDQSVIYLFSYTNPNPLYYRIRPVVNSVPGDWEGGTL